MMGCTHKVVALTTASMLNLYDLSLKSIISVVVIVISATLPDMDSLLGKKYHRKFTHSLLSLMLVTILAWGLYEPLALAVMIGYGSHIAADSFTKMGVPVLYPYRKMYGLKIMTTGSTADWFIFLSCAAYIYLKYLK